LKTPIIFSLDDAGKVVPIFSQGDYDVVVGALEENKLPMYVVINRTTGVVEFTHEVTAFYKDWLNHFSPSEFTTKDADSQLPLSLSLKN
jgi:hypothetical protein